MAWARHVMCESALTRYFERPFIVLFSVFQCRSILDVKFEIFSKNSINWIVADLNFDEGK